MKYNPPHWYEVAIGVAMLGVAAYGGVHITRTPAAQHAWWEWAFYGTFLIGGLLGVWPNRTSDLLRGIRRAVPVLRDPGESDEKRVSGR